MPRLARTLSLAAGAAGLAAVAVVATAPNDYPTPADSLWGRLMPPTQATITVTLIAAAAVLAGTGVFVSRLTRRRGLVAAGVVLLVAVGLYLLSVLTWRLHAPAGAGNGG